MALVNGTEYFYSAYFYDASGNYTRLDSSATPNVSIPQPVITSLVGGNETLEVIWNKVMVGANNVDEYTIYYGFAPGNYAFTKVIPIATVGFDLEIPSYELLDVDNIVNNSTYYVAVSATSGGTESVKSVELSVTPQSAAGGVMQPLNVKAIAGDASFRVQWDNDLTDTVTSWTIFYGEDVNALNHSVNVLDSNLLAPVDGMIHFDLYDNGGTTPVVNSTMYFVKVKAHVGVEAGISSEAASVIPQAGLIGFVEGAMFYVIPNSEILIGIPLVDENMPDIADMAIYMQSPYAVYYDTEFKTHVPGFPNQPNEAVAGATAYILGASDRSGEEMVIRGDEWSNDNLL